MQTDQGKSRAIFGWIFFFVTLLPTAAVSTALFFGLKQRISNLLQVAQSHEPPLDPASFVTPLIRMKDLFWISEFPIILAFFFAMSLCLWLVLRGKTRLAPAKTAPLKKKVKESQAQPQIDPKIEQRVRGRLFLHLLTVFQRDGRLVDFLSEDLSQYEDGQIGAAVRSIHADCKKVLDRQLELKPVMDQEEDSEVTVPANFDPISIKLTGNVVGSPPFKGILRHRGWRAGRLELPTLSGDPDPQIVSPAEVEIL
jgi:hypothetical protein